MTLKEKWIIALLSFLFCLGYARQNFFLPKSELEMLPRASLVQENIPSEIASPKRVVLKVEKKHKTRTVQLERKKTARKEPNALEKVNISTANARELQKMKGVGPKLAQRIVEFRKKSKIRKPADLLKVKGIGPSKLKKITPQITFDEN